MDFYVVYLLHEYSTREFRDFAKREILGAIRGIPDVIFAAGRACNQIFEYIDLNSISGKQIHKNPESTQKIHFTGKYYIKQKQICLLS